MLRRRLNVTKAPKLSKRWYEEHLDDLVRQILRLLETYCVTCGANWNLEVSHLFGRAMPATRYDIEADGNNHMQCRGCNRLHNSNHQPYTHWYVTINSREGLERLEARAKSAKSWSHSELETMYSNYQHTLSELRKAA